MSGLVLHLLALTLLLAAPGPAVGEDTGAGAAQGQAAHDDEAATPLHQAAIRGRIADVLELLSKGAGVNSRDKRGATPLHYAAGQGKDLDMRADIVTVLVQAGANIDAKDDFGASPLHKALMQWDTELVLALISHGADVNAIITPEPNHNSSFRRVGRSNQPVDGWSPLHLAASLKMVTVITCLLKAGASPHAKTEDGLTPSALAAAEYRSLPKAHRRRSKYPYVVRMLRRAEAQRRRD